MWTSVPLSGHDPIRDPQDAGGRARSGHGHPGGDRKRNTKSYGGGGSHRSRSSHRSSAAEVDGIARPRDLRRRTGLSAWTQAPGPCGDGDARTPSSRSCTTRSRAPGANDRRECATIRSGSPPASVHRGCGVTERTPDDRRDRSRPAAHGRIGRQGVPRIRSSRTHRGAPRDCRSAHTHDSGRRTLGASARGRSASGLGVERRRERTRRGIHQRARSGALRSALGRRLPLRAGAACGPDLREAVRARRARSSEGDRARPRRLATRRTPRAPAPRGPGRSRPACAGRLRRDGPRARGMTPRAAPRSWVR
jgi:hypothetical protein